MQPRIPDSLPAFFWSWRRALRPGLFIAILRSLVIAPIPLIFKSVVDRYVPEKNATALLIAGGLLVLMLGLHYAFSIRGAHLIAKEIGARILELRGLIFARIQHLNFGYLDQQKTGRLLSKYAFDTQKIEALAMQVLNQLIPNVFYGGTVAIILICMNWELALALLLILPFYYIIKARFFERLKQGHNQSRLAQERMTGTASELLGALRLVRSFGTEDNARDAMSESSEQVARTYVNSSYIGSHFGTFIFVSTNLLTAFVILGGGWLVILGKMSMGTLVGFVAGMPIILLPLQVLIQLSDQYFLGKESYNSIRELLESPFVENWIGKKTIESLRGEIAFCDVSFSYPCTDKTAVSGLNLTIRAGEKVALAGPSGAGKTTIASLLLGLYEPTQGRILIDGVPQEALDMQWLRRQSSIVMQESILLSGTVADNIRFGRPNATDAQVEQAAAQANALDFIRQMPKGFQTVVGERGATLSGGQRQRISIARAILRNPKILILDEPTSALDYESEHLIQQALDRLTQGRTVITIAHRLSTIENADRIIVLAHGQVVESGTYHELASRPGYFHDLLTPAGIDGKAST